MDTLFIYLFAIWSVAVGAQIPKGGSSSNSIISVGIAVRQGEPSSVIAQKGGQLLLNCSVEYTPELGPLVISWTRDGEPVDLGTKRVQLLQNGSLYFRRVRHRPKRDQTDAGQYQCLATLNKVGTVVARDVEIKVAGIERRFLIEPEPQQVPLGGVARFQCKIQATPPALYIWQKDQKSLPQNDNRFLLLSSGILQITGVRADDAGSYRCCATQGFIHDQPGEVLNIDSKYSSEARLDVTGALIGMTKIVASSQNVTVTAGTKAVLECLVQGSKKTVIWKKENQRLSVQTDGRITLVGNNLEFLETTMDDAGKYQCVADNIISTMSLTVIRKPVLMEVEDSLQRQSPKWVYLKCLAEGHPKPKITWLKDAKPMDFTGSKYSIKDMTGGEQLVIVQTDTSHSGYYQCVASNAAGSTSGIIRLDIIQTSVDIPQSATNLRAESVSKSHILVTWDQANAQPCCPVLAYTIHYQKVGGPLIDTVTTGNRFELKELQPFSEYKFYVVAYSRVGSGPQSEVLTVVTDPDVPYKPVDVTLVPHAHSIRVEWEELPKSDRNGNITSYKLFYRRADGGNGTNPAPIVTGPVLSHVITGLESEIEYEVRAVAGTLAGFSSFNSEKVWPWVRVSTRNENYVVAPEILVVAINVTSVNVTWSYAGEAAVKSFTLTVMVLPGGAVERTIVLQPATRHHVLNQLDETTVYKVSLVVEKVDTLTAEVVEEFHMATVALPPTPHNLRMTISTSDSVAVTWREMQGPDEIVSFTVRYVMLVDTEQGTMRGTSSMVRSDTTSALIQNLQAFTQYEIAVCAHTDQATSKFSDIIVAQTQEGIPSEPQNVQVQVTKPGSVNVRWSPPLMPNGHIKSYVVMYTNTPSQVDDTWVQVTKNGSEDSATISLETDALEKDKVYYFKVFASTEKGAGKPTLAVSVEPAVSATTPAYSKSGLQDEKMLGLIIGVTIAVTCIVVVVIVIIIFLKNRCVGSNNHSANQPQTQPPHYHGNGHIPGHGNGHTGAILVGGEHGRTAGGMYEMEAYSPMLPENENSDSKGGGGNMIRNQNGAKLNGFVVPLKKNGIKNMHNGHVTSYMPSQYHTESLESEEHRGLMAAMLGCTTDPCLNENGGVIGEESFTVSGRYEDLGSLDDIDHSSCEGTLGKPQSRRTRGQSGCDSSTVDSGEGSLTASDRNSGADTGSMPRSDTTDTGDTVVFCGGPCARPPSPSAVLRSPPSSSIEDSGIHVDGVSSSSSVGGVVCADAAVSSGHDMLPQLLPSSFSSTSSPTTNGENFRHGDEAPSTIDMETSLPASSPPPHSEHRQELPQNQLSTSSYSQARGPDDDNSVVGSRSHSSCGLGHPSSPGTELPPVRFANGGPPGRGGGPSHLGVLPVSSVTLPLSVHPVRGVNGQTDSGDRHVYENGSVPHVSAQGLNRQDGERSREHYPPPPRLPHSPLQQAGETTLLSHGSREGRTLDETFAQLPQDTVSSSPSAMKSLKSSKSSPQNHRHYQV